MAPSNSNARVDMGEVLIDQDSLDWKLKEIVLRHQRQRSIEGRIASLTAYSGNKVVRNLEEALEVKAIEDEIPKLKESMRRIAEELIELGVPSGYYYVVSDEDLFQEGKPPKVLFKTNAGSESLPTVVVGY